MNALPLMRRAAAGFCARLCAEPASRRLALPQIDMPPVTLEWENTLLASATFRRAHIETFVVTDRLSVLHVCVFPHLDDPGPIFGFDMIAGPARVTGIFLDLSPVHDAPPAPRLREVTAGAAFAEPRELPDWGDIFSPDMLAIRPRDLDEVQRAIDLAGAALDLALTVPRRHADAAAGQFRYVTGQRRNEHTFRMLSGFIGPVPARRFIDEVLFPEPQAVGWVSEARPITGRAKVMDSASLAHPT